MPKHHKFEYQGKLINTKQLSQELNISYSKLLRLIKNKNCQNVEDIIIELNNKRKFKVGDKYGKYTIISNTAKVYKTHIFVKVKCECGKITEKQLSLLKSGRIKGCANCMARERSSKVNIGDCYKNWKVIDGPRVSRYGCIEYKVLCLKCNKTTRWIQPSELKSEKYCYMCYKCAQKERGKQDRVNNGGTEFLSINKFHKIKRSAEIRNLDFNITIEYLSNLYLLQNKKCALTGDDLLSLDNASLDRIDSSKGYIEGNVQWVTSQANVSKHIMTLEELYEFCRKVLNHANQQPSQPLTKLEGSETNS